MIIPEKTTIETVGGTPGTKDFLLAPPWQTESADAVLVAVSAWGNTAPNLLYVSADGDPILQGALSLASAVHGIPFVINGAGSVGLAHLPVRIASFLRVTVAPAANGQIFLSFYWQRLAVPDAGQSDIPLPEAATLESYERRRGRQERQLWGQRQGDPPAKVLRQEPQELTERQKARLRQFERLTDTKPVVR